MKCTVTFTPSLKSVPNGQGHRITGEYDPTTQLLWVKCTPNAHAPAGRFAIHCGSRSIIAPAVDETKQAGEANRKDARA